MIQLKVNITNIIKNNNDIVNTFVNYTWRLISGPLTMLLIPLFLDPIYQGYWYTFGSMAALSVFADLGFTTIVTQFAAHEFAYLEIGPSGLVIGNKDRLDKLSLLFRFIVKWAVTIYIIAFPAILVVGLMVLNASDEKINWIVPWVIYILFSGINFINSSVYSFFEGCNQIPIVQRVKFISTLFSTLVLWASLLLGYGLWSLVISTVVGIIINTLYQYLSFKITIRQLMNTSLDNYYSWRTEFLKLIWKYAISWSSGYFTMQLFTPFIFKYKGAADAGKIGISISLVSAVFTLANVWFYTSTPKMNMYSSKGDWKGLDILFKKTTILSLTSYILGSMILVIVFGMFQNDLVFLNRFVEYKSLIILIIAWFFQLLFNALAIYLRSHKQEPYMLLSAFSAIYVGLSTFIISKYFPTNIIFLGYLSSFIFVFPAAVKIFINKRKEWHSVN